MLRQAFEGVSRMLDKNLQTRIFGDNGGFSNVAFDTVSQVRPEPLPEDRCRQQVRPCLRAKQKRKLDQMTFRDVAYS